jgi:hypothetical protein
MPRGPVGRGVSYPGKHDPRRERLRITLGRLEETHT